MTVSMFLTKLVESGKTAVQVTEGRILFLLYASLLYASLDSLINFNATEATVCVTAYVAAAQLSIDSYFSAGTDNNVKRLLVVFMAAGYCAIFLTARHYWRSDTSMEIAGGFTAFLFKICKEYFSRTNGGSVPPQPTGETK